MYNQKYSEKILQRRHHVIRKVHWINTKRINFDNKNKKDSFFRQSLAKSGAWYTVQFPVKY